MVARRVRPADQTGGNVYVWTASLDVVARQRDILAGVLSEDERARAGRFLAERDRRRFVVCRGILRTILARYARKAPAALEFRYGTYGKPALSARSAASDLRFNVSHSEDTALYAVAFGREIGIDVERVRADLAIDDVAARFFSAHEQAALRAVPSGRRSLAFFRIWTRKEAILKAQGGGLFGSLSSFVVSSDARARLLSSAPDPREAARWRLEDVPVDLRHIGAIAVEGTDWVLRRWEWRDGVFKPT